MAYSGNEWWPDRPPTAKQYAYAWKIANELNIMLPPILDITAFSKFIEHYKDPFGEVIKQKHSQIEEIMFESRMRDKDIYEKTHGT